MQYFEVGGIYKVSSSFRCILFIIDVKKDGTEIASVKIPSGSMVLCIDVKDETIHVKDESDYYNRYWFLYNNEKYFLSKNYIEAIKDINMATGFIINKKTRRPKRYG